jgi:AraC-like DNA-binding protein
MAWPSQQVGLRRFRLRFSLFLRHPHDLGPTQHQAVVRQRLGRALLALAQRVEPIAEFARDFGLGAELGYQQRCGAFAA